MDRNVLKKYAPQARRDFIAAVMAQAGQYGLTKKKVEPVTFQGDVALIGGKPFPVKVGRLQQQLAKRIEAEGFDRVMEAVAYTWFNRFVAIRYMEIHGYLDHGYRVLSHPGDNALPEIVEHAEHVTLPGLKPDQVVELKLAGNKDDELYRMLLVAQCNALHAAMPFLFEKIDDETELLLPENLLHSDSLIRNMVNTIPEDNWQEIEIIGWLYQFYISEKKDEVIGKVVKTEDIPAATQLFTPNWIVKYMVQNSIGRQWLATYPDSPLRQQMEYYIEPAEQTEEVQAQLKAITPDSLNPEEMTLLDPACGSGHIEVEAYDLFKAMYLERGYRMKDIPRLILRNNLFGLEIDERAAQLASFALIMKARADDRRVLEGGIRMNIRCIQSSDGIKAEEVYEALTGVDVVDKSGLPPTDDFFEEDTAPLLAHLRKESAVPSSSLATSHQPLATTLQDLRQLLTLFKGEDAKAFGSLIRIPDRLAKLLPAIVEQTDQLVHGNDLARQRVAERFAPIAEQALLLSQQYDAVVANPPYMGGKGMNKKLRDYARKNHPEAKSDLYAVFIDRLVHIAKQNGLVGLMTPFTWMFLKSYQALREIIVNKKTIHSLIQPEYHAFFDSAYVPICTFVLQNHHFPMYNASFIKLSDFYGAELQAPKTIEAIEKPDSGWLHRAKPDEFAKIPDSPIAYWVSNQVRKCFSELPALSTTVTTRLGMTTANNDLFTRNWFEVSNKNLIVSASNSQEVLDRKIKWVPYNKGGFFRKWYGNMDIIINWRNDGYEIKHYGEKEGKIRSTVPNTDFYFRECLTWSKISSGKLAMRYRPEGSIFDVAGACVFGNSETLLIVLGFANSPVCMHFLSSLSPTLNFEGGQISSLPFGSEPLIQENINKIVPTLIKICRLDWDSYETSWDFTQVALLHSDNYQDSLLDAYASLRIHWQDITLEMQRLEKENNRIFIKSYGLQKELVPEVPLEEITLTCNPYHRYSGNKTEEELDVLLQTDTIKELLSYAAGCMMGRYSLDVPGLVYAHSGNEGFDPTQYKTFPADDDGIVPLTDMAWFEDDVTERFATFMATAWPKEHLEENLQFISESLGQRNNETPRDTIRRYFATEFFKDHLKTYKRRPIYWLFSSGKQRAFQCLVYLHRYNEGTLSRMRTEYVIPLQGKMTARMEHLENDITAATTTSQRKKCERERDLLRKQLEELRAFDEKLRHYADQRITLDLDDGVKVNYGKFGNLLSDVKAVTGKKPEE